MPTHERAVTTDGHGRPYCAHCGLLEHQWPLSQQCDKKPILSIVPPSPSAEDLPEVDRFMRDPLTWLEEWNDKNGKVSCEKLSTNGYSVCLWVEGLEEHPLSTGVAPTLTHAFKNAISGLDSLAVMR